MNLNGRGQAALGVGSGPGSVDGRDVATPGGGICFLDDDRVILQTEIGGQWVVIIVRLSTGEVETPAPARGANALAAGGGRWMVWLDGTGLYGTLPPAPPTDPQKWARAGLITAGPDGALAYCPSYASGVGIVLNAPDGSETVIPDAMVVDRQLQVLGPTSALWLDFHGGLRVVGRAPLRPALTPGRTRLIVIDGATWLVYQSAVGLVAQRDGAADGWILEPRPITFNHDARDGGVVGWSVTQGEGPADLVTCRVSASGVTFLIDPDGKNRRPATFGPLVAAAAPVDVPRIGRPLWFGFYRFGDAAIDVPGNCELHVDGDMLVRDRHGTVLWHYVAGASDSDPASIESAVVEGRKRYPGVPVLAYWPRQAQHADPPSADGLAVEMYRQRLEAVEAFERRGRAGVAKAARPVWLVGQGYSSNLNNTGDLVSIPPVCARIARDEESVEGIIVFSAGTRPTGWDDHQEIHAPWTAAFDGIPSAPSIVTPKPAPAPKPVPVPVPAPVPSPAPVPLPLPEDSEMKLPARCFVLLHNSNIGTVAPGAHAVELAHTPQEYGAHQEVEVTPSKDWTPTNPRVLVRFVAANRLFRVDKVLAGQQKYEQAVGTWDPAAADADSSWQQGLAAGSFIHFTSDSVDGARHGTVYTLTCVGSDGQLFQ